MKRTERSKPRTGRQTKEKFYLTYPSALVTEPLIHRVGQKFKVVTNIRGASISRTMGLVALELSGTKAEIEGAIEWLRAQGVHVEPIEKNVIE